MSLAADSELHGKIEDYRAREHIYLAGLVEQEAETGRLKRMAADVLGAYGDQSRAAVRGALANPVANMEVLLLRQKTRDKDRHIIELRDALEANRFNQASPQGQALVRKCRALLEENQALGEQLREERVAELRAGLRAEQQRNTALHQKCAESSDFCKELSQENEKLQGTIAKVAARLREAKAEQETLAKEKKELRERRKRDREVLKAAAAEKAAVAAAMSPAPPVITLDPSPPAKPAAPSAPAVFTHASGDLPVVPIATASKASAPPPSALINTIYKETPVKEKKSKKRKLEKSSPVGD